VTIKTKVSTGKASAMIETNVPDYKTINLELESDFTSQASLLFELNESPFSVVLKFDEQVIESSHSYLSHK